MNTSQNQLLQRIDLAFKYVDRPETSLRQFLLTDLYGMVREITDAEWNAAGQSRLDQHWKDIPDAEMEECGCLLAHMEAQEFQYYLAAYMRYSVNHIRLPDANADIIGSTVFSLHPSQKNADLYKYKMAQFSLLTPPQKRAIFEFLDFVSNNADDLQRPEAQKAIARYWGLHSVDT